MENSELLFRLLEFTTGHMSSDLDPTEATELTAGLENTDLYDLEGLAVSLREDRIVVRINNLATGGYDEQFFDAKPLHVAFLEKEIERCQAAITAHEKMLEEPDAFKFGLEGVIRWWSNYKSSIFH